MAEDISPYRKALFQRDWRIRISTDSSIGKGFVEAIEVGPPRSLDCTFKVTKTTKHGNPNKCTLEIYNLDPNTRMKIEMLNLYDPKKARKGGANRGILAGKDGATRQKAPKTGHIRVEIEAGYVNTGRSLIFRGDLRRAISVLEDDRSWCTKIEGEDGGRTFSTSRVRFSYPAGTRLRAAVVDCAEAMGIGLGNIIEVEEQLMFQTFTHGTILDGSASSELAGILRRAGVRYTIADNALLFLPVGKGRQVIAVLLNAETGMVGSPQHDSEGFVQVKSLMNPSLALGGYVQIQSTTLGGTYRVEKLEYEGSTFDNDWYVTAFCRP